MVMRIVVPVLLFVVLASGTLACTTSEIHGTIAAEADADIDARCSPHARIDWCAGTWGVTQSATSGGMGVPLWDVRALWRAEVMGNEAAIWKAPITIHEGARPGTPDRIPANVTGRSLDGKGLSISVAAFTLGPERIEYRLDLSGEDDFGQDRFTAHHDLRLADGPWRHPEHRRRHHPDPDPSGKRIPAPPMADGVAEMSEAARHLLMDHLENLRARKAECERMAASIDAHRDSGSLMPPRLPDCSGYDRLIRQVEAQLRSQS